MELTQLPRDIHSVKTSRTRVWAVALGFGCCVGLWGCSGVGPPGKPVVFGDQTNIIIWDEKTHTEHFIRNATFKSGADDFGFIAPTPGKPTLSEASSKAFNTLASLQPIYPTARGGAGFGGGAGAYDKSAVKVIQVIDVAGYQASTLWSKDAHAINNWMNDHGYISTPEVEKWCERYCSRGWYLTAFKVIDRTKLIASTGTVRMSFKTQKAFNPFYVPSSNIPINRGGTLIVYFVSVGDYAAKIGNGPTWQTPQWKAPIPEAQSALLAKQVKIPAEAIPDDVQVSTFIDPNFPRVTADDIYFTKKIAIEAPREPLTSAVPTIPPPALPRALAGLGVLAVAGWRRRA
jgi:hypothetical protein